MREHLFSEVSELFHKLDLGMLPISVVFPYLPIKAHRDRDAARAELSQIFTKVIRQRKASGAQVLGPVTASDFPQLNAFPDPPPTPECLEISRNPRSVTAFLRAAYSRLERGRPRFRSPTCSRASSMRATRTATR